MATVFVDGKQKDHVREGLVRVITGSIEFSSNGDADMIKITEDVAEAVRHTGLSDGTVTLFVPGATGALTTLEFEPGVVEDVQRALDVVAPAGQFYQHNVNLGDGNGHSHVRAGPWGRRWSCRSSTATSPSASTRTSCSATSTRARASAASWCR